MVKRIENGEEITPEDFLLAIEDALGSHNENVDKSQYFKGVNDMTLRLANHRGSATMFLVHDHVTGNTSVVVKMSEQKSKKNKEVDLKEFVYFPDKMNADVQRTIINGLREWGETGAYNQPCDQINVSTKKDGVRLMKVYHGSGADFDHFDNSHIGEGEGAQVFGWGTYVTSVEGIGEYYAEKIGKPAEVTYDYTGDIQGVGGSNLIQILDMAFDRASEDEDLAEYYREWLNFLEEEQWDEVYDWFRPIHKAALKLDPEKFIRREVPSSRFLYTVEIPEDNGSNYLDYDAEPTKQQKETIIKALMEFNRNDVDDIRNILKMPSKYSDDDVLRTEAEAKVSWTSGNNLYGTLSHYLGTDAMASKFLSESGFTGIAYLADYKSGGRADGAKNYVIFNESDAKITDKVRFFRTESGEAYGYTVGGKIYIDPRIATAETPIHEYAHLWASALKAENPKEWKNGVSLMKGTSIWDEVKERYPELKTDDAIADEVLAHYSGRRGAERLREEERKAKEEKDIFAMAEKLSAIDRLRRAFDAFWKGVADFLHIHYTSAEEVADRVMKDLMEGVDPRTFGVDNRLREQLVGESGESRSGNRGAIDVRTMSTDEKQRRGEQLLETEAIDVASNQIGKTEDKSARQSAVDWWKENVGGTRSYEKEVGIVDIDEKSIGDSLAHRYSQAKLDAITSLADGFNNAVYLGSMPDFTRQEGVTDHYFAYPINYEGKRCYVFCRAMQDTNKNRLYVHEVFVADNLKEKGDTLQTAAFQPHGGIALYRGILSDVISAANVGTNSESASVGEENSFEGKKYSTRGTESAGRQPLSEKTRKACESVAEALGVDVEWVDHMEANGEFVTADEEERSIPDFSSFSMKNHLVWNISLTLRG